MNLNALMHVKRYCKKSAQVVLLPLRKFILLLHLGKLHSGTVKNVHYHLLNILEE